MGVGVKPMGTDMFRTFLKAQEKSPTLVLAHAGIEDHGANEIARFVQCNTHLVRLDLTGNSLSATGAAHLGGGLRQTGTLESLVLRHNRLGEGGDAGLATLCKAIRESRTLKHLDLRHNNLSGALGAALVGEMLQGNNSVTHLELSWNPLDPAGGQVLMDHMQQNTTLFDCQLTGCGIAGETLLAIAQILHRNRIANGASMQAGPYQVAVEGTTASPTGLGRTSGTIRSRGNFDGASTMPDVPGHTTSGDPSGMVVSSAMTQDFKERLMQWSKTRLDRSPQDSRADVHQLFELLNRAQAEVDEEVDASTGLRRHVECMMTTHHDRCLRYQNEVEGAQDKLLDYQKEHKELKAIQTRVSDELQLHREATEQLRESLAEDHRRYDAEDSRSKNDLANIIHEKGTRAKRLLELQEHSAKQDAENKILRAKVEKIRSGVVVLQSRHTEQPIVPSAIGGVRA